MPKTIYSDCSILSERLPDRDTLEFHPKLEEALRALAKFYALESAYDEEDNWESFWGVLAYRLMDAHVPAFSTRRRGRKKLLWKRDARRKLLKQVKEMSVKSESRALQFVIDRWKETPEDNPYHGSRTKTYSAMRNELAEAKKEQEQETRMYEAIHHGKGRRKRNKKSAT